MRDRTEIGKLVGVVSEWHVMNFAAIMQAVGYKRVKTRRLLNGALATGRVFRIGSNAYASLGFVMVHGTPDDEDAFFRRLAGYSQDQRFEVVCELLDAYGVIDALLLKRALGVTRSRAAVILQNFVEDQVVVPCPRCPRMYYLNGTASFLFRHEYKRNQPTQPPQPHNSEQNCVSDDMSLSAAG